jgi:HSP20 family molecular chaperone IbpA
MTTREQIAAAAYETEDAVVVELELPDELSVDSGGATATVREGTLELRVPKRGARHEAGRSTLPGFHPDAPPS